MKHKPKMWIANAHLDTMYKDGEMNLIGEVVRDERGNYSPGDRVLSLPIIGRVGPILHSRMTTYIVLDNSLEG